MFCDWQEQYELMWTNPMYEDVTDSIIVLRGYTYSSIASDAFNSWLMYTVKS